jgi:hypothetical protein
MNKEEREIAGTFISWVVIITLLCAVLGVAGDLLGLYSYAFFAPRVRAIDNHVFKESEQYNDGMIRDLEDLQMQYMQADAKQKQALRAIVLHRFSVYPEERMPIELREFYNQLRSGQ